MTGQEIVVSAPVELLNPTSGELLAATPENAAAMLADLRELRGKIAEAVKACEAVLVEESTRVGTKTLRFGATQAVVSGGSETVWDVEALRKSLTRAGCPEERIGELIVETVEYRVNQSVARQLSGANPKYKRAIERARTTIVKPMRVSVKEA